MTDQTVAVRPEPSPASRLIWGLISTALLAGWIAWHMGWVWAVAGVFGVFVHEFGHVLAMNALGSGPGRIVIVPFVGGAAIPKRAPSSEFRGVLIALAGPVFGLLAMAPFFTAFAATGQTVWLGGAFFIAVINLLNLAPAPPLDGSKAFGPALAWVHPWIERGALILIGALVVLWAVQRGSWIFAVFVGLGVLSAVRSGQIRTPSRRLTTPEWLGSLALYAAALALCLGAVLFAVGGDPASGLRAMMRLFGG